MRTHDVENRRIKYDTILFFFTKQNKRLSPDYHDHVYQVHLVLGSFETNKKIETILFDQTCSRQSFREIMANSSYIFFNGSQETKMQRSVTTPYTIKHHL